MNAAPHTENTAAEAASRLSQTLTQAGESQRAVLVEMTSFAKDESQRFINLRLERTHDVMNKLSTCQGVSGLLGVQQEWLRDLMQDYGAQNMRLAGALRGVTHKAVASATEAATGTMDRMQGQAADAMRQGEAAMHEGEDAMRQGQDMVRQTGEQIADVAQDAGNNYVQH
jgi:hypothetical protein